MKTELLRKIGSSIQLLKLYNLFKFIDDNREKPPYKLMYFCGLKGIDYLNSSLLSVYKNWLFLPDIIIITDGTPVSLIKSKIIRWPRNIEIDTWESCANFFSKKGNSNLFNYANNELWGKKFVSILAVSDKSPILYSDTDVLWFSDPIVSISPSRKLPYMKMSQDIEFCYSDSMLKNLNENLILNEPPRNAGVIYSAGNFSNYPKWEYLCNYLEKNADNRTEQTSFAILNSYFGETWDKNEIFIETEDMSSVFSYRYYNKFIARHYVNTKKWLFWRDFLLFLIFGLKFSNKNK